MSNLDAIRAESPPLRADRSLGAHMLFSFQRPMRPRALPSRAGRGVKKASRRRGHKGPRLRLPIRLSVVSSLCSSTAFVRQRAIVAPKSGSEPGPDPGATAQYSEAPDDRSGRQAHAAELAPPD